MSKKYFFTLLFSSLVCFISNAQQYASGIWLLTDKTFSEGAAYQNGVPKIITIDCGDNGVNFKFTISSPNKDTLDEESYAASHQYTVISTTLKGRQKKFHLDIKQPNNLWIRQVDLSAVGNINQLATKTVDSLQFSEDGKTLWMVRHYQGDKTPQGTADYSMIGTYKKVTKEELILLTTAGPGVEWTAGLTWNEILAKAKRDNKYVFVDCYATWCGPCKKMDTEVYPLNWVSQAMGASFISVRVQMDTAKNDSANVRLTYPIARKLEREYKIDGLPTYLFFNSDGEIVDKAVGFIEAPAFVQILHNAGNPKLQVYTRYRSGLNGTLPPDSLKPVIQQLLDQRYNDKEGAKTLMRIYINENFYSLTDKQILTKDNLEDLFRFWSSVKSNDRIFRLLYQDPEQIDRVLVKKKGEDYTQRMLESIIMAEEVLPEVNKSVTNSTTPNWYTIERVITKKYHKEYAVRPLLTAQVWWYKKYKKWEEYCNYLLKQVEIDMERVKATDDPTNPMNGITGLSNYLNSSAWNMVLHCDNKKQLAIALNWSKQSIELDEAANKGGKGRAIIASYDTYGRLLYKLGRKEEALTYYKTNIMDKLPENANKDGWAFKTFRRMLEGQPISE